MLGIISRFLRCKILNEDGQLIKQDRGTPQGSIMSPILANIYLHYVLDLWFQENYISSSRMMVRYADDVIFLFADEQEAKDFTVALQQQLTKAELALNEDKTHITDMRKTQVNVFHFLGFTFYWAMKKSKQQRILSIKTAKPALHSKIRDYTAWIKRYRNQIRTEDLWEKTAAKLRGHYEYYGYFCNKSKLNHYYFAVLSDLFKWLNRRSQKRSYSWEKFKRRLQHLPLPKPPTMSALKSIGWDPYAIAR